MQTVELLQGDKWLGHPVHPLLVAGPIGMWTFSLLMDGIAAVSSNECIQEAADHAITAGFITAGLAVSTGLGEYNRVPDNEHAKRHALLHAVLNASAMGLYGVNTAVRSKRRGAGRPGGFLPKLLSLAGAAVIGYSGWLGGGLAYNHGTGVSTERGEQQHKRSGETLRKTKEMARKARDEVKARI